MSYDLFVYCGETTSGSVPGWREAIAATGIDLEFYPGFDPSKHRRWLPVKMTVAPSCQLRGAKAFADFGALSTGFSFTLDPPYEDEELQVDHATFRCSPHEGNAAGVVAAAGLAAFRGVGVVDPQRAFTSFEGESAPEVLSSFGMGSDAGFELALPPNPEPFRGW